MAPRIYSEIVEKITSLVNGGNQELINSLSQPAGKDNSITFVPTMGKIKDIYVSTIIPHNYLDGTIDYYANVEYLIYECGTEQKGFSGLFILDENLELTEIYLVTEANF